MCLQMNPYRSISDCITILTAYTKCLHLNSYCTNPLRYAAWKLHTIVEKMKAYHNHMMLAPKIWHLETYTQIGGVFRRYDVLKKS